MNRDADPGRPSEFPVLERLTAAVLLLVLAALGWMVLAARFPAWAELLPLEAEIVLIVGLLTVALVLVSVVALLHTRG